MTTRSIYSDEAEMIGEKAQLEADIAELEWKLQVAEHNFELWPSLELVDCIMALRRRIKALRGELSMLVPENEDSR